MLKKAGLVLILCFQVFTTVFGQYQDDVNSGKASDSTEKERKPIFSKENAVPGLEFMLTASGGAFFAELSPFVGIRPVRPFMAGVGVHGSYLAAAGNTYSYYGVHGFGRLIIADQFFLHAEYRLLNGFVPGSAVRRQWVSSPIFALGIQYGPGSYMMLGYARDVEFQEINPLGSFVYRLGIYF